MKLNISLSGSPLSSFGGFLRSFYNFEHKLVKAYGSPADLAMFPQTFVLFESIELGNAKGIEYNNLLSLCKS